MIYKECQCILVFRKFLSKYLRQHVGPSLFKVQSYSLKYSGAWWMKFCSQRYEMSLAPHFNWWMNFIYSYINLIVPFLSEFSQAFGIHSAKMSNSKFKYYWHATHSLLLKSWFQNVLLSNQRLHTKEKGSN